MNYYDVLNLSDEMVEAWDLTPLTWENIVVFLVISLVVVVMMISITWVNIKAEGG